MEAVWNVILASVCTNVWKQDKSLTSNTIHATNEMEPEMPERASDGLKAVVEGSSAVAAAARKP